MLWYGVWALGFWFIFPVLICIGMMAMMMLMGRGHLRGRMRACMGMCRGHVGEAHTDPDLKSLRQRLASGELPQ